MRSIPLSLYIHLPWCTRKCPYCDFNSHPSVGGMDEVAYIQALRRDLAFDLEQNASFIAGRKISSIFFGGGTPSLFSSAGIAEILESVNQQLSFADNIEITLEANPGSSEQTRFAGYRHAGVNRLSIGVQSFDAEKLQKLGRVHDTQEAIHAAEAARKAGFDNFNLDLMYALPEQTLASAASDLRQAIALAPTHISYYQLTMEPGTHFYLHPPPLPDDELAWDMHLQGIALMAAAGYVQYEVSAYAQPQQECRHNLNYWGFGDYLGLGAGAHGKLSDPTTQRIIRIEKQRIPLKYMRQAGSPEALTEHREILLPERGFEFLLNALRLKRGFSMEDFRQTTGLSEQKTLEILRPAISQDLLRAADGHINCTELGWRHIDSILTTTLQPSHQKQEKLV